MAAMRDGHLSIVLEMEQQYKAMEADMQVGSLCRCTIVKILKILNCQAIVFAAELLSVLRSCSLQQMHFLYFTFQPAAGTFRSALLSPCAHVINFSLFLLLQVYFSSYIARLNEAAVERNKQHRLIVHKITSEAVAYKKVRSPPLDSMPAHIQHAKCRSGHRYTYVCFTQGAGLLPVLLRS